MKKDNKEVAWMDTLKSVKAIKEGKDKPIKEKEIFDFSFKKGGTVKKSRKKKETTKDYLYKSLNRDIKNTSYVFN